MRWLTFLLIAISTMTTAVRAEYPANGTTGCNTSLDPLRTNLTIIGDSLSELVYWPVYGDADWEFYLTMHRKDIDWSVQNMGSSAWTIGAIYDRIRECASTPANRNTFKMAANVAMEGGGNDFILNLPTMIYLPWAYPSVEQRVLHNTRLLVKALKHPRRHKNVLVMGNFPTITRSPTLGARKNFFTWWQNSPGADVAMNYSDVMEKKLQADLAELASERYEKTLVWRDRLVELSIRTSLEGDLAQRSGATDLLVRAVSALTDLPGVKRPHCATMEWYCAWLDFAQEDFGMNTLSIAMLFHQSPLEQMAREEGAEFLPLYPYFIRHQDCAVGHCYVGQPALYNDPVHVSYLGYFAWSSLLSDRLASLGWTGLPTNGGLIDSPATAMPPEEAAQPPIVTPNPLEWLIACFVFKFCHL